MKFSWSPTLAYIIGLLATDGNLSKDKRHICIRSSDKDLLETFKQCLSLQNKIAQTTNNGYARKPSFRIQFGNVAFYNWLLAIGLFPSKTHTIGELSIPDLFFKDFLRGHLDGDGSIITYKDNYNTYRGRIYTNQRIYVKFISASYKHINWLMKKTYNLADIKGSLICNSGKREKGVPIWALKFSKKESLKLLRWIYYHPELPSLKKKKGSS